MDGKLVKLLDKQGIIYNGQISRLIQLCYNILMEESYDLFNIVTTVVRKVNFACNILNHRN